MTATVQEDREPEKKKKQQQQPTEKFVLLKMLSSRASVIKFIESLALTL